MEVGKDGGQACGYWFRDVHTVCIYVPVEVQHLSWLARFGQVHLSLGGLTASADITLEKPVAGLDVRRTPQMTELVVVVLR
jgi:hypothetical protein